MKGFRERCVMELGGQTCPEAHNDTGLVELLPLTVGGLGFLAASLPVLLVMCQTLELLTSHAPLKRDRPADPSSCSQAGSYLHHFWPVIAGTCFKYLRTPTSNLKVKAQNNHRRLDPLFFNQRQRCKSKILRLALKLQKVPDC